MGRDLRLLPHDEILDDFPLIKSTGITYLDNAATSQKPVQVIEAVRKFYREFNANIHRGIHGLGVKATRMYEEAHEVVAKFIGARSYREVIFTRNATESLNTLSYMLEGMVNEGDEIVISIAEHHSNMLPWFRLARVKGAKVRVVGLSEDGRVNLRELERVVSERTKIVAINYVSNVLGTVNDITEVARITHKYGALLVVDGAQGVPHLPTDVRKMEADFLAFSAHKMLGPTGLGVLWGREDLLKELTPPLQGGGMIKSVRLGSGSSARLEVEFADLPWRFEAGTPNIAGAVGFIEAINYLSNLGMHRVRDHERYLTEYTMRRLREEFGDLIEFVGPEDPEPRTGIISFVIKNINPHVVAAHLSVNDIAVRSGFHCAQPLHEHLGFNEGSVRVSFYVYNGPNDVEKLIQALKELVKEKG